MDLTEAQWEKLKPQLAPKRRPDGRGRPWRDTRAVLNGILWGFAHRRSLARSARPLSTYQTCPSPLQQWQRDGTLTRLLHALAEDLRARGKLDLSETFIDRQLSSAKKGGAAGGPTRRGKGSKIMAIADRHGSSYCLQHRSASPHETKLVEATVEQRFTRAKPKRMIGDRAYDCDPLDQRLRQKHRIQLIAPHKYNRRRKSTQDAVNCAATAVAGKSACPAKGTSTSRWKSDRG